MYKSNKIFKGLVGTTFTQQVVLNGSTPSRVSAQGSFVIMVANNSSEEVYYKAYSSTGETIIDNRIYRIGSKSYTPSTEDYLDGYPFSQVEFYSPTNTGTIIITIAIGTGDFDLGNNVEAIEAIIEPVKTSIYREIAGDTNTGVALFSEPLPTYSAGNSLVKSIRGTLQFTPANPAIATTLSPFLFRVNATILDEFDYNVASLTFAPAASFILTIELSNIDLMLEPSDVISVTSTSFSQNCDVSFTIINSGLVGT